MRFISQTLKIFATFIVFGLGYAIEDKIAASVDTKVITERDIEQRYQIIAKMRQGHQIPPYDQGVRKDLLDQLVEEQILALLWSQQAPEGIEIVSQKELDDFINGYSLAGFDKEAIKSYYELQRKRHIIARERFGRHIDIPSKEIDAYLNQGFDWSSLPLKISFKIAYGAQPLNEKTAQENARSFSQVLAAQVPTVIFSQGRWEYKDRWQFFETEDEYAALFVEDYSIEGILDKKYTIELYRFEGPSDVTEQDLLSHIENGSLPEGITNAETKEVEVTHRQQLPKEVPLSQEIKAGQSYLLHTSDIDCSYAFIKSVEPQDEGYISEYIRQTAKDEIVFKRVEQSFHLWLDQAKPNFYVKIVT